MNEQLNNDSNVTVNNINKNKTNINTLVIMHNNLKNEISSLEVNTPIKQQGNKSRVEHSIVTKVDLLHIVNVTIPKLKFITVTTYRIEYYKQRDTVAIALLYIFGLPMNQLLSFTYKSLVDLVKTRECVIYIKKGEKVKERRLVLDEERHLILKTPRIWGSIQGLINNKYSEEPLFTSYTNEPLHVNAYNQKLNEILEEASKELKKEISIFCFRYTIRDMLMNNIKNMPWTKLLHYNKGEKYVTSLCT